MKNPHWFWYTCLIHDDACVFINNRNKGTGNVILIVIYADNTTTPKRSNWSLAVTSRVTAMTTLGYEIHRIDNIARSNQSTINLLPTQQTQVDCNTTPGDGTNPPNQNQVGEFRFLADRTRTNIAGSWALTPSIYIKHNSIYEVLTILRDIYYIKFKGSTTNLKRNLMNLK